MPTTEQLIQDVFAAFNRHDLAFFKTLLAADAQLSPDGGTTKIAGPEVIAITVGYTLDMLPDLKVTVNKVFTNGEHGVAEVIRTGTHTGALELPDGSRVEPTGNEVSLPECIVFTVRRGKITHMNVYTDQLSTGQQLGMI